MKRTSSILLLASIVSLGACREDRTVGRATSSLASIVEKLGCSGDASRMRELWSAYERLALAYLATEDGVDPIRLERQLEKASRAQDRSDRGGVEVRSFGENTLLLLSTYQCGFYRGGGRLSLIGLRGGDWRKLDQVDIDEGFEPELVLSLSVNQRAVLATRHLGTQIDRARIVAFNLSNDTLEQDREVADIVGLEISSSGNRLLLTYETETFPLRLSISGPRPRFEESWILGGTTIESHVRSLTPWLDALATACAARDEGVPCDGVLERIDQRDHDTVDVGVIAAADGPWCDQDRTWRDQSAVIRIESAGDRWIVSDVKPVDPACSAQPRR